MTTEGVIPDYQKDPNPYQSPGAGGPANREALALERIADTLDNIAALLASQRVPAGGAHPAGKNGDDEDDEGWIDWNGGEQPVPDGAHVYYRLRTAEGGAVCGPAVAEGLDWMHGTSGVHWNDIVAYRLHKP